MSDTIVGTDLESVANQAMAQSAQNIATIDAQNQAAADLSAKNNYYKTVLQAGGGALGGIAGIIIAVKRKSGFLGGVGWFFAIGIAGGALGFLVGSLIDGKPKDE